MVWYAEIIISWNFLWKSPDKQLTFERIHNFSNFHHKFYETPKISCIAQKSSEFQSYIAIRILIQSRENLCKGFSYPGRILVAKVIKGILHESNVGKMLRMLEFWNWWYFYVKSPSGYIQALRGNKSLLSCVIWRLFLWEITAVISSVRWNHQILLVEYRRGMVNYIHYINKNSLLKLYRSTWAFTNIGYSKLNKLD